MGARHPRWRGLRAVQQLLGPLLMFAFLMCAGAATAAEGVQFEWRAADLLRQQRAFSSPRAMFDEAEARLENARRQGDLEGQLSALLEAATAAIWLGEPLGDVVLAHLPKVMALVELDRPAHREVLADLLAYQALILIAKNQLDDAQAALSKADYLSLQLPDPGHLATNELARSLLTLLRDDAAGALRHLDKAYELAAHDMARALIKTWQASVCRRASYFQYDLLRLSLQRAKESEQLASAQSFPALGLINIATLAQSEALLGENIEAIRRTRVFAKMAANMVATDGVTFADSGMVRILAQFRRQDIVLAEQLGRRRVLLTWGLLAAGILATTALTATIVQTRQRRALSAASAELVRRNEQLQQAHRTHTRLLAASCHDLREPAHALSLLAETAAVQTTQGSIASPDEQLATIRFCSTKLTDMLSELLDLTRIEAGQYLPERSNVPLRLVFNEIGVHFQEHARRQGILFEVATTDCHVRTDPYLLSRVLFSLVGTAIKATLAGQVRVSAVLDRHGAVQLRVQDSGNGMPSQLQSPELDRRAHLNDVEQAHHSLDLGVSIVRRAADLLEIPLAVTSQAGRGTIVTLTLESAPPPQEAPADHMADSPVPELRRWIAVLEDDTESRQGMASLLRYWGYEVVTASSVQGLREALDTAQHSRPDLLITDLHLGPLNGLEEAAVVRAWPGCSSLPVMLLTGDQDPAVAHDAAQAQVSLSYKPLLPRQLLASIRAAMLQTPRAEALGAQLTA